MPIQHSPPARQTRSQAGTQSTEDQIWKEKHFPGRKKECQEKSSSFSGVVARFPGHSRTTLKGPGEDGEEEEDNSVEGEGSDGTECVPAPVGASQGTGGPTLAQYNQSELSLLAIMQKMTQIMANLQEASSSEESKPPAFKTPSMKSP
ncbi:hypothetical protein O181_071447 [Austropuccinia psidii MF-1]|uniref:Uncharacterized protein n=1 Tax=Austropuccinia psidii MF-1 TaxID=1389203 RepID=A0A9Q3I969_9BASI|nr:hypothetical protein [Austropuccinia psidii MF-1]